MAQKKGKTGNPNGRPKGTPNKVSLSMKEFINGLLNNKIEQLTKDFDNLDEKDRWIIAERLLQYTTPKMSSLDPETQVRLQVQFEYQQLEQLLRSTPDEAVNAIASKILELQKLSKNG